MRKIIRAIFITITILLLSLPQSISALIVANTAKLIIKVELDSTVEVVNFELFNNYRGFYNTISVLGEDNVKQIETEIPAYGDSYILRLRTDTNYNVLESNCLSSNNLSRIDKYEEGITLKAEPYDIILCNFKLSLKNNTIHPVLIIPGLGGSELSSHEELIWPNITKLLNPLTSDNYFNKLSFNSQLQPIDQSTYSNDVIRSITKSIGPFKVKLFDYSETLEKDLVSLGYIPGKTLWFFPYDWRSGVSKENLLSLKNQIWKIKNLNDNLPIDVIAHSLGGLLFKKYVADNYKGFEIRKAVMVGVPNLGSLKAVKTLLVGDSFGIPGISTKQILNLSKNYPSIYQLIPLKNYVELNGPYFGLTTSKIIKSKTDFLYYDQMKDYYLQNFKFHPYAFVQSEVLHTAEFDQLDLNNLGVLTYNIAGCLNPTLSLLMQRKNKIKNSDLFLTGQFSGGDGTVLTPSSTGKNNNIIVDYVNHGQMLTDDVTRPLIVNLIKGENFSLDHYKTDASSCKLKGKQITVFSPVSILVKDNENQVAGIDNDLIEINNIKGVGSELLGDHKLIYISDSVRVKDIIITGIGDGKFSLLIETVLNDKKQSQEYSDIPVFKNQIGSLQDSKLIMYDLEGKEIHYYPKISEEKLINCKSKHENSMNMACLREK